MILNIKIGKKMHNLMRELWPYCRSITGDGVRKTLEVLKVTLPNLNIVEVPTGSKCFDWIIPKEWVIRQAYILDSKGIKILDFNQNNLHVVSYSSAVNETISLNELQNHLYSLPNQPDAIPYVTSYYKDTWGFCLTHRLRESLKDSFYKVVIDSEFVEGSLTYGELILPGTSEKEILLSTYICHPSMANNELSGPCLAWALSEWISNLNRKYTYRIIFVPETIGAICYLSKNYLEMQRNTIAGFVLTCVGDEKTWSFLPSIRGNTLSDLIARHTLKFLNLDYKEYSFLNRGSDERQYCSPGIDLPIASVMRSKYMTYPEYHTSLDNLDFVTAKGLAESFTVYTKMIEAIEMNCKPKYKILCEPKMGDRGLRSTIGKVGSALDSMVLMNLLMYADGNRSLLDIAEILNISIWQLKDSLDLLVSKELLSIQ
jgi:aminopeptidase-like protein